MGDATSSDDGLGRLEHIRHAVSEFADPPAAHEAGGETGLHTAAELFQKFVGRLSTLSAAEVAEIARRGPWKDFVPDVPVDESDGLLSVTFADDWISVTVVQGEDGKWYSV